MNYNVNDKVTIQSKEWYESNKQANGFIIFKDNGKVSTFSPGMVKFCDQTFTVAKVVTGSSIYPDHYTFVEDGGSYKWTDDMIAGLAGDGAQTYTKQDTPQPKVEAPKSVEKPVDVPKPVDQKPKKEPVKKETTQKTTSVKKEERQPEQVPQPEPIRQPEPVPQPEPVRQPQPEPDTQEDPENGPSAFDNYTILLKPKQGSNLAACAVQAYRILSANQMFPSVEFEFNGFIFNVSRKNN